MSYVSWRNLHTELATENYPARVFGISAGIVRIGLEQVTRKETTVTRCPLASFIVMHLNTNTTKFMRRVAIVSLLVTCLGPIRTIPAEMPCFLVR